MIIITVWTIYQYNFRCGEIFNRTLVELFLQNGVCIDFAFRKEYGPISVLLRQERKKRHGNRKEYREKYVGFKKNI